MPLLFYASRFLSLSLSQNCDKNCDILRQIVNIPETPIKP